MINFKKDVTFWNLLLYLGSARTADTSLINLVKHVNLKSTIKRNYSGSGKCEPHTNKFVASFAHLKSVYLESK